MTDEQELVGRYYETFNRRDWDAYEQLFSADVVGWAAGSDEVRGVEAKRESDKAWVDAFPDARVISTRTSAVGGAIVAAESHFAGTHTGTMHTPQGDVEPTGKGVDLPYVGVFEVEEGKLKAHRIYYDRADLQSQLGL